jgi:hypothetical protein
MFYKKQHKEKKITMLFLDIGVKAAQSLGVYGIYYQGLEKKKTQLKAFALRLNNNQKNERNKI